MMEVRRGDPFVQGSWNRLRGNKQRRNRREKTMEVRTFIQGKG